MRGLLGDCCENKFNVGKRFANKETGMRCYQRYFVAAFLFGFCLATGLAKELITSNVRYIRNTPIADLKVPDIKGQYYNDLVPNTLDIAERAKLAINVLTEITDAEYDYEMYFSVELNYNPPFAEHNWSDVCGPKFWEALPLMRYISGSQLNSHVDAVYLEVMLRSIGPDGLFYIPFEGRPWARTEVSWANPVWRADGTTTHYKDKSVTQVSNPMPVARVLQLLVIYYQMDRNHKWKELIEKMIEGSFRIMVDKGDYGYIPNGLFEPNAKVDNNADVPVGVDGVENNARIIHGPARYYRLTGYEPGRKLATKIVNCVRDHGKNYAPDGHFLRTNDPEYIHFHSHVHALIGMIEYAVAVEDEELLKFIEKCFKWARSQGNPTVGFFPEFIKPGYPTTELCCVSDMISVALKLSRTGIDNYYYDAERWTRNQFAECQMTKTEWVYEIVRDLERTPEICIDSKEGIQIREDREESGSFIPKGTYTEYLVPERNIGCFAGWARPNDWGGGGFRLQHCCAGNSSRTLYYIWDHILDYEDGELKINMLLNRVSPWVDLYSYIPYKGQVRLKVKQPCKKIRILIPEWVNNNSPDVKCIINGQDGTFSWEGRYIDLGKGRVGDTIDVVFPINVKRIKEEIAGKDYTLTIKGNTVIAIDTPGEYCPLYQNGDYQENQMQWRPVTRFVADQRLNY